MKPRRWSGDIEEILSGQPEWWAIPPPSGMGCPVFMPHSQPANAANDYAQIMVRLDLDKGGRFKTNTWFASHLQQVFDAGIPNARVTVKELEQGDPTGAPVTVKLTGDSMETLAAATEKVRAAIVAMPGTVNVEDNLSADILEFKLDIDSVRATLRDCPSTRCSGKPGDRPAWGTGNPCSRMRGGRFRSLWRAT